MKGLENLAKMEYPGRGIIIGKHPNDLGEIIAYFVTGRSPSSQAREIVVNKESEDFALKTNPTDPEAIKKGNKALLIYNCIRAAGPQGEHAFIVSNGAQTDLIHRFYEGISLGHVPNPMETLARAFANPCDIGDINITSYEPDEPNYTPRISGIITPEGAALHIVKCGWRGYSEQKIFEVPMIPGKGKLLTTYTGVNVNPLPSFEGEPLDIVLGEGVNEDLLGLGDHEELAENIYQALRPSEAGKGMVSPGKDFRVAVATLIYNRHDDGPIGLDKAYDFHIINRHERGE